jgi:hypothetical protein
MAMGLIKNFFLSSITDKTFAELDKIRYIASVLKELETVYPRKVRVTLLFSFVVLFALFGFSLCLVSNVARVSGLSNVARVSGLSNVTRVSLDCPFLIAPSVFSNIS